MVSQSLSKIDIKSLNEDGHFFEGAEKLLEIWFGQDMVGQGGSLRKIPREDLDKMLNVANCHILHSKSNAQMDSYVLSESSLFITDCRLIMKTCGETRLLNAVPHILSLAERYGGFATVSNVYYSRKNFLRPHLQPDPHKCFNDEVDFLNQFFPLGEAYCLGPMNSTDCWFLFAWSTTCTPPDRTLEIQMTDLPEEVLKVYSKTICRTGRECTRKSGLFDLMPFETDIHEELFEPVGYSMNGLIGNTDQYLTVHVTPEPEFTYVSFETNQRHKPRNFILTIITNNKSLHGENSKKLLWNEEIPGYRCIQMQFVRLAHDIAVYAQFVKTKNMQIDCHVVVPNCENDENIDDNSHWI